MKQSVRDVLSRQRVDRILPPLGFWGKAAVLLGWGAFTWIPFMIFFAGLAWWIEILAEWWA